MLLQGAVDLPSIEIVAWDGKTKQRTWDPQCHYNLLNPEIPIKHVKLRLNIKSKRSIIEELTAAFLGRVSSSPLTCIQEKTQGKE